MLNVGRLAWFSVLCLLVHCQMNSNIKINWFIPAEETQRLKLPGKTPAKKLYYTYI